MFRNMVFSKKRTYKFDRMDSKMKQTKETKIFRNPRDKIWFEQISKAYEQGKAQAIKQVLEIIDKRFSETNEIDKAEWNELKQKIQALTKQEVSA